MARRISFWATKKVPVRQKVTFRTSTGKRVSFLSIRRVPQRVRVTFRRR